MVIATVTEIWLIIDYSTDVAVYMLLQLFNVGRSKGKSVFIFHNVIQLRYNSVAKLVS